MKQDHKISRRQFMSIASGFLAGAYMPIPAFTFEKRKGTKELITSVPTGFTDFDRLTSGLRNKDLIILGARPSMGKTAFALNIARNAAVDANIPVAYFSLELSKKFLLKRMLAVESRIDLSRLVGGYKRKEEWIKLKNAADVLSQASIFIDDSASLTAMEISARARTLNMKNNLGLIIIDYIELISGQFKSIRTHELTKIANTLKDLADELSLPVIAITNVCRTADYRPDKRPRFSDLNWPGEKDADVVVFMYREDYYKYHDAMDFNNCFNKDANKGKAEIIITKNRNGHIGVVDLAFLTSCGRFENLG
jgi:replicative DNA helicase